MFEEQWRERASPTTPPRPCQGPSLDQHVLTYIPEVGLLAVVARAGPQVSGVGVALIADHLLVEAAVRVGVVVGDLEGGDDPVHVLLDRLGRGFYIRAFSRQGVLVRVLAGIGVDHGTGVSGAVPRAIVPRMILVRAGVDEELE